MSRKLKLTPELLAAIEQEIGDGNYVTTVCQAHGINRTSFYDWKNRGEKASSGLFRDFYEAVERATAKSEQKYVEVIKNAANDGTWTAAAWWLERRYPDRWGKREKVDVTSGGKPIQPLDLKNLTDDELEILEKIIGGSGSKPADAGSDTGGEGEA